MVCTCFPSTQWGAELKQSSRVDTEVKVAKLAKRMMKISKSVKSSNSPKTTAVAIRESLDTHFLDWPPEENKMRPLSLTINFILNPTLLKGKLGGFDQWFHS